MALLCGARELPDGIQQLANAAFVPLRGQPASPCGSGHRYVRRLGCLGPKGTSSQEGVVQCEAVGRLTEGSADVSHPRGEPLEDIPLRRVAPYQVQCVHAPALTDPIDPPDPLLQPHRVPRQLDVDDEATPSVEVEPFAGGVRRQQHAGAARVEGILRLAALGARESAVQYGNRAVRPERLQCSVERVAILGEDDCGLTRPPEQCGDARQFAFRHGGEPCRVAQGCEETQLAPRLVEPGFPQRCGHVGVGGVRLAGIVEWQHRLFRRIIAWAEQVEAMRHRTSKRPGAGSTPLQEHRHRQSRSGGSRAALAPDGARVLAQQRVHPLLGRAQ